MKNNDVSVSRTVGDEYFKIKYDGRLIHIQRVSPRFEKKGYNDQERIIVALCEEVERLNKKLEKK